MQSTEEMRWTRSRLAAGAGVVLLALVLRVWLLPDRDFWYDELLSASFSVHGPLKTLLMVLRFDVHPPLYYMQLSVWGLLGHGDAWLAANSIFWSVAAVALLLVVAARRYGFTTGLTAAALLAISPAALAYADQLRMYPFIAFLMILAWETLERWLDEPKAANAICLILAQTAISYSHAIGILMLSGCVIYGGVRLLIARDTRRLIRLVGLEALVLLLSVPALVLGAVHNVPHVGVPSPGELVATWTFLATGSPRPDGPHALFGLAFLGLIAAVLAHARARTSLACLALAPLVVAAMVSFAIKPVWLERIFVPMLPLLALSLALAFTFERGRLNLGLRIGLTALAVVWLGLAVFDHGWRPRGDGFAPASRFLLAQARPGQQIVMSESLVFWSVMRELEGPEWGDPLHEQLETPRWTPVIRRLPPMIRDALKPEAKAHDVRGARAVLVDPRLPWPDPKGDLLVVTGDLPGSQRPPKTIAGRKLTEQRGYERVIVQRWSPIGS